MKILAIDVGGMSVKYTIFENKKQLQPVKKIALIKQASPKPATKIQTLKVIKTIYQETKKEIAGVALSSPGAIDKNNFINGLTGIKNYDHFNLLAALKKECNIEVPIIVLNDGNAAAYADYVSLGVKKTTSITLPVGTGVGGGIVNDGKIWFGKKGFGGEFGYTSVFTHEAKEPLHFATGSHAASLLVLQRNYARLTGLKKSGAEIFQAYDQGEKYADECVKRLLKGLAIVIYNLSFMINPNYIFIAGGLSKRRQIAKEIKSYILKIYAYRGLKEDIINLRVSRFAQDAQLWGVYYYFLANFKLD